MSLENKTQFQNYDYGGVGALHDPSWIDKYAPKRPHEVNSAGFQVNRFAKFESYDADEDGTREPVVKLDSEDDPMIGIIEPLNFIWRLHEYNKKDDPLTDPNVSEAASDRDIAGIEIGDYLDAIADAQDAAGGTGRRRPHSKVFAFGTISGDKHLVGSRLNRSTIETRYSDYRTGARHQIDLVRECLTPEGELSGDKISDVADTLIDNATGTTAAEIEQPFPVPKDTEARSDATAFDPEFWPNDRIMAIINEGFEQPGGYVFQSSSLYSNRIIHVDDPEQPPSGNYAQWGDVFTIPDDDIYAYTQRDNNARSLLNIWTKAHFYKTPARDGPIDMVDPLAPEKSIGLLISGDLRILASRANADPTWGYEAGKWVPVVALPILYDTPWADPSPWTDSPSPMYVTPEQHTVGRAQTAGFRHDVMEMVHGQESMTPMYLIPYETVPLQFRATFITPIPAGEILARADAVFRWRLDVLRHGGRSDVTSYTRCGDIVVPIAADGNPNVVSGLHSMFHAHDFFPGDVIMLELTRDWNDQRDTAGYMVYAKVFSGRVGTYCLPSTFFGTKFADSSQISDGVTATDEAHVFS